MKSSPSSLLQSFTGILQRFFRKPGRGDLLTIFLMLGIMLAIGAAATLVMVTTASSAHATPLTVGDRVQLVLENGEGFSGKYQIDLQGQIELPYAGSVSVSGMETAAAARAITQRLELLGLFRTGAARTTLQVLWWAPLNVRVSGEVFNPGTHSVNMPPSRDRTIERAEEIPGAYVPNRNLSDALKAAGGITTWADLGRIAVRREGSVTYHDVHHLLTGLPGLDPALQEGDEVVVARMERPDAGQARPSGITPPGIKIFAGNMVQNQSNAPAANALGSLPMAYGSRLSQAVVAVSCAGGIGWSNSSRTATLLRTDRLSGVMQRWNVLVEKLLTEGDGDINPLLQEGDAVICYDSQVTGWREVLRVVTDILIPVSIFRNLP